jgi:hypothetical protein
MLHLLQFCSSVNDSYALKALETDLPHFQANVSFLLQCVTKLEEATVKEISNNQGQLNKISGSETDKEDKFRSYFSNNNGLKVMCEISCKFLFSYSEHRFNILNIILVLMVQCSTASLCEMLLTCGEHSVYFGYCF